MMFFKQFFKDFVFDGVEVAVRCPFPHLDENGKPYFEERPSAHINTDKGTFHCKVCGEGYSETKLLAKLNGISYREARKLIAEIEKVGNHSWDAPHNELMANEVVLNRIQELGITRETIKELQLGYEGAGFSFPVFMYGELLDVRTYNPTNKEHGLPKVMSRKGAQSNLIVPFDIWQESNEATLLMAGEKDMALARSLGYNAITFTGGEQAFPRLFKASFRGKKVYIAYDNDEAGKTGARKVAALLKDAGAIPFVIEGHHLVCTEKGGDFWDYIMQHSKTKADFDQLIAAASEFTDEEFEIEKEKFVPTVKLIEANEGQYRNRLVRSSVQITATFDQAFGIADFVEAVKTRNEDGSRMQKGDKTEWALDESNIEDILLLMDSKLKADQVEKNLKKLCGVEAEKFIKIRKLSHDTVFKASMTDLVESGVYKEDAKAPHEVTVYTIGEKLQSGKKYKLTYKLVQHPLQAQEMVAIVTNIEASDDTVSAFQVNEKVLESLKVFQGNPFEKMEEAWNKAKGLIGSYLIDKVFYATDLVYHSPLEFKFGRHDIRGTMDAMVVGESRTGKSATAEALLKAYGLGTFTTLKNASVAGVVGGSNKIGGQFKTMVGTIPRNHKGLVVFEEFSGAPTNFINTITDIRSSGQVRITRVNGELVLPATVRMLSISNQKTSADGMSKPLRSYPNGISILVELVGAAEDIARYDYFVLVESPPEFDDPLAFVDEPYPSDAYRNRVRWVWSRKKEQIQFAPGVDRFIVQESTRLNKEYNCHIKFFGTEAWKKLAKISVAVAGCCCSMDETGENLVVQKEHVEWAAQFMSDIYDNDLFRLKQYVQEQNRYSTIDDHCIRRVEEMYAQHTTLLAQMEMTSSMSSRNLQAISGMDQKEFAVVMNELASLMLFQWQGDKVQPSERFRKAMSKIDRNHKVKRLGEV
jgi:DNA primase